MRRWGSVLIALVGCLAPEAPKDDVDAPDTDAGGVDSDPGGLEDTGDSAAADPAVDTVPSVDDTGWYFALDCDALRLACLTEGEDVAVCEALFRRCEEGPWTEDCLASYRTCLAEGGDPIRCEIELLVCFEEVANPTPTDTQDPCDGSWRDCVASGRDTATCVQARQACLSDTGDPTDDTTGGDILDTAGCAARVRECVDAGLPLDWCEDVYRGCADADSAFVDPCVEGYADCLDLGGAPADCLADFVVCVSPADTGLTCRSVLDDCLRAGGSADACQVAWLDCTGQDIDPALACRVAWEACLDAGTPPVVCDAELSECLLGDTGVTDTAGADTDLGATCDQVYDACLGNGRDPLVCAAERQACLTSP